jgi:hypothetical protein
VCGWIEGQTAPISRLRGGALDLIIVDNSADAEGISFGFPLADYAGLAAELKRDFGNFGR